MAGGQFSRRERKPHDVRSNRVNLSFNEFELTVVSMAAQRAGMATGAWAARAAVAVAREQLVPVSADAQVVLRELIGARVEVSRLREELVSGGALQRVGSSAVLVPAAVESVVLRVVGRLDAATVQVMRERVERS
ncbi:hypothetical protein [Kitasatospora terrestris]|uniref:Uncharacterized protein n=1 Tax=Kitasatospora terrestris TaxID=258051 RepID=A0ABP9DBG2_9ACTN